MGIPLQQSQIFPYIDVISVVIVEENIRSVSHGFHPLLPLLVADTSAAGNIPVFDAVDDEVQFVHIRLSDGIGGTWFRFGSGGRFPPESGQREQYGT